MRGLYFLAFLALLGAASAGRTFSKNDLPDYMRNMQPHQIVAEVKSLVEKERAQRGAIDDAILALIEQFRDGMSSGFPALGIPVLDPLFVPHINYNLTSDLMDVNGYISQTTVQNTSTFIINTVNVNPIRLQLNMDFTWPEVNMGGLYDVDGTLTVLPIYGTGPFTATLHNFWFSIIIDIGTRLNGSVYIKEMPLDMHLEALTNNFEGMMGGGAMGQMVNDMITDMAPELLNSVKAQILTPISDMIVARANAVLVNYTLQEIIDIILGGGGGATTTAPVRH